MDLYEDIQALMDEITRSIKVLKQNGEQAERGI